MASRPARSGSAFVSYCPLRPLPFRDQGCRRPSASRGQRLTATLLIEAVGQCRRRRFVDVAQNIKAGDPPGIFGWLPLSLTSIFLAPACEGFGISIFNTPFVVVASMLDGSTPGGNPIVR